MTKIFVLGTGAAFVNKLYNSCFVINNEEGNLLVDTGGSVEIINRLKHFDIDSVNNIFITHTHTDHILGLFWLLRRVRNKINIYCHDLAYDAINNIINYLYSESILKRIKDNINLVKLNNLEKKVINGLEYEFFDTYSRGIKQFGFRTVIDNKKLAFFGDEPISPTYYQETFGYDYVIHEVLCQTEDEERINPDKLFHSSTRMVGTIMEKLKVKNIILIHTNEDDLENKKASYKEDLKKYYSGNIYVPFDYDVIKIGE